MSWFEVHRFHAHQALASEHRGELRDEAPRAVITPTSFVAEYNYDSLPFEPGEWLGRGLFVVYTRSDSHAARQLWLWLPADDPALRAALEPYLIEDLVELEDCGDVLLIRLGWLDCEGPDAEMDDDDWARLLVGIQRELREGEPGALWLGWFRAFAWWEEDAPPLPPGLVWPLSEAQQQLARYLFLDTVALEALLRAHRAQPALQRSMDELQALVQQAHEADRVRQAELARQERAEQARRERAELLERAATRRGREDAGWRQVTAWVEAGRTSTYDQALALLPVLNELATERGARAEADEQVKALLRRWPLRRGLQRRFKEAGYTP